ncbi:MAG: hypothetical protein ACRDTF_18590 [Pseudonocardiaceae bacterium]
MTGIWGSREDWNRAIESVVIAIKILAKGIVGADYAEESRRLDELAQEGLDSLNDRDLAQRYRDQH